DDDAGRQVGDAHGRVGRVDALPAVATGAVDVDLEVVLVDLDVDLLGLGQHGDGGGRGMDPAARLGHRDALHPVHAALEFKAAVGTAAADLEDDLLIAADPRLIAG